MLEGELELSLYLMVGSLKIVRKDIKVVVITRLRIGVGREGYKAMVALIQMVPGGVEH